LNSISESFIPVIKKYVYDIAFTIPHTLNTFTKCGKDSLDPMSHLGVVYKITCHDRDASYVGQTKRQLRTRIKEHVSDINKKNGSSSVISEHRLNSNHEFKWENLNYGQRTIISKKNNFGNGPYKKQLNGLNKQSDTDLLPTSYLPILDLLPPS